MIVGKTTVIAINRHNALVIAKPVQDADCETVTTFEIGSVDQGTVTYTGESKICSRSTIVLLEHGNLIGLSHLPRACELGLHTCHLRN